MRFERLVVEGFGPIAGESLDFAPGMTVVFGPNESAKSTLHAALYAALCGFRRARGQPRVEDREFAARHRPWGGGPWRVQTNLQLEDGRLIELWHDLDGGVDCRALDSDLGRDVSNEIMFEGAPDGSRWLGFDRGSFLATACVRQSAIAAVLESANALQDELQRAAASAGRDETAANAIERLKSFASENVGLDRANIRRPLRRAITTLANEQEALEDARMRHDEYLAALVGVGEREAACHAQRRELQRAEAAVAHAAAAKARNVVERASDLARKYPEEPQGSAGFGQLGDEVAQALALWDGCPAEPDLSGETLEQLETQLAQIPERPEGDLTPAEEVLDAETATKTALEVLEQHARQQPPAAAALRLPAEPEEMEQLAAALDGDIPRIDPELRERVATLRTRVGRPDRALPRLPLGIAGVLAIVGIAATVAVSPALGIALLVVAAVVTGMTLWLGRQRSDLAAADALATAERMLDEQQVVADEATARRAAAVERLRALGLSPDPDAIRTLLKDAQAGTIAAVALDAWNAEHQRCTATRDAAFETLKAALLRHHTAVTDDVLVSVAEYKAACAARDRQEREANRRPGLEQRLAARRAAEADATARAAARERLLAVAAQVGITGADAAVVAQGLREWQGKKQAELGEHDVATAEWTELKQLLGDRSLDELRAEAAEATSRADAMSAPFREDELASIDPDVAAGAIPSLREELERLDADASFARGDVERMAKDVPSVPEAEERVAAAEMELARVRGLQEVLARTVEFLEAAQGRVHRSIAPVLQGTLRAWLPRVVVSRDGGTLVERYDDAMIDPESLLVQVRRDGGPWRNAALLSEGTKEQIFLLLRVALAEHLTKQGERSPLILDEITAQCDSDRRVALLDLVHELSRDRQVILFTHDEGAFAWAEEQLDFESGTDRLERREALVAEGV